MADDRVIDGEADAIDEFDRDTVTLPRTRRTARGTGQVPPREDVARRYAIAAERRRLLSHALHTTAANNEDDARSVAEVASEHAVTGRYMRLAAADLEAPALAPTESPRLAEGSQPTVRPPLNEAVERLREQAAQCRAQAIALNAKLVMLEADRAQLHGSSPEVDAVHAVREQLIESSARLDHAVDEIEAVTSVEEQLSTLR